MASVSRFTSKRDNKPYYKVKWRTPDGKHRTKGGFRTRKEADAYATSVDFNQRRGTTFDPRSGDVTFRVAAAAWLDSRHDLKATTRRGYAYALAPATERRGEMGALGIDAVFGGYPLNAIKRERISEWVDLLVRAGKKPSTVRHAYFLVRMVLAQAVVDGRLTTNPADYVRLPGEHSATGGTAGVVDDPAQFLTATQVAALVAATPWPFNVYVHIAAWAGLRAAELAGLQVGDVELPTRTINPNVRPKPGTLRVERTVQVVDGVASYVAPKTRGSRRRVPLTPATVDLLRSYLAEHPRADDPTAPLFPAMRLISERPTGIKADGERTARAKAGRQADALAALDVQDAELRLALDWTELVRHPTFYKAVFRPAVLRANRLAGHALLPADLKFHALRHTYASLCVAAGIAPLEIARFMGHAKVTTTLTVYAHLFEDDHTDAMSALGAMDAPTSTSGGNVLRLRR
ncbi:tyrosine-type recombinase/integrase [Gordonia alkanivorans]|uniref:Putative phage integrase family protein n=1 Tax=Gordonia alkanivorans NBRC 16433 TaxID=1027371 RepID=F9VQX4_9ACTN|nr:tyrosine-type recombinase/integrase [Gordonia alkanivorans]GAA11013.1 putative phage integrase family protein [Gordonia alkanivorans NBRC 16433]